MADSMEKRDRANTDLTVNSGEEPEEVDWNKFMRLLGNPELRALLEVLKGEEKGETAVLMARMKLDTLLNLEVPDEMKVSQVAQGKKKEVTEEASKREEKEERTEEPREEYKEKSEDAVENPEEKKDVEFERKLEEKDESSDEKPDDSTDSDKPTEPREAALETSDAQSSDKPVREDSASSSEETKEESN